MSFEGKAVSSKSKTDGGRVYWVESGKRRWIRSPAVMRNLGVTRDDILWIDDDELLQIPLGENIEDPNGRNRNSDFGRKAFELLKGKGIEIGPLYCPFDLDASVLYLDRFSTSDLRERYKDNIHVNVNDIKNVHLISNSDYYPFLDDNAFDFIVSSHVLEHTCNPGRVIEEWIRVVRSGSGIVYIVLPDKNYSFDKLRNLTTVDHLMQDYYKKTSEVTYEDYEDYFNYIVIDGKQTQHTPEYIKEKQSVQESIHVHTYTAESFRNFLEQLKEYVPFDIIHFEAQGLNIHAALQKR